MVSFGQAYEVSTRFAHFYKKLIVTDWKLCRDLSHKTSISSDIMKYRYIYMFAVVIFMELTCRREEVYSHHVQCMLTKLKADLG